jgi:transcriptional regulator with XRE-family HTH domain
VQVRAGDPDQARQFSVAEIVLDEPDPEPLLLVCCGVGKHRSIRIVPQDPMGRQDPKRRLGAVPLGAAIRAIRSRRGENLRDFAARLGVGHSTVSKYERDVLRPSRSMLLLLYPLAETTAEKEPIVAALGSIPEGLQVLERQLDRDLAIAKIETERILREMQAQPETRQRLLGLALRIARDPEIPLWLPNMLSFWHRYRYDARLRDLMNALMGEVVEKLHWEEIREELGEPAPPIARRSAASVLLRVMIRCPQTKKPVFTGAEMTPSEWERSDFEDMRVSCPHCHLEHRWNKSDAYVEGGAYNGV